MDKSSPVDVASNLKLKNEKKRTFLERSKEWGYGVERSISGRERRMCQVWGAINGGIIQWGIYAECKVDHGRLFAKHRPKSLGKHTVAVECKQMEGCGV